MCQAVAEFLLGLFDHGENSINLFLYFPSLSLLVGLILLSLLKTKGCFIWELFSRLAFSPGCIL